VAGATAAGNDGGVIELKAFLAAPVATAERAGREQQAARETAVPKQLS
jgi:hypothetical protein